MNIRLVSNWICIEQIKDRSCAPWECLTYLVIDVFAHEERGDVEWQDVLQEELVDVLHGLHLISLCLEAALQQEIYTAAQLILREKRRSIGLNPDVTCMAFPLLKNFLHTDTHKHTHSPVWPV